MSYENQDRTLHETHAYNRNCEYCANSLQGILDSMKYQKLPDKTLFGDLQGLAQIKQLGSWENQWTQKGRWIHDQDSTGLVGVSERLPKYVQFMSHLATVRELFGNLADSLEGKQTKTD